MLRNGRSKKLLALLICLALMASLFGINVQTVSAAGTTYYVSITGSDSNSGTSEGAAWKTLSKVNTINFVAGDKILLEGGKTFSGNLVFNTSDGGNGASPVLISSYGSGRATIDGGTGNGISIEASDGIKIQNLNIIASGVVDVNNFNNNGIKILNGSKNITIDQVDISKFKWGGIFFNGTTNLTITNVNSHDNGYAGISSRPAPGSAGSVATNTLYIGYTKANYNKGWNGNGTDFNDMSGQGIELFKVNNGIVEYCETAYNGELSNHTASNGPVGMWCCFSDNILMQYNISHNNRTFAGHMDGGGYDFDFNTTNSIMQYNYSYDNDGPGILLCCISDGTKLKNNIIRYNISMNDGLYDGYSEIHNGIGNLGGGMRLYGARYYENVKIYNNLIYTTRGAPAVFGGGGGEVIGRQDNDTKFYNNIFLMQDGAYSDGTKAAMIHNVGDALFQGNLYYAFQNPSQVQWISQGYYFNSLAEWRNCGTQWGDPAINERVNGNPVGIWADPKIPNLSSYPKITDPTQLSTFTALKLNSDSPCINAGLNIQTLFGLNPGSRDFYNVSLPQGAAYDIGANEYSGLVGPTPTPTITPTPGPTSTPTLTPTPTPTATPAPTTVPGTTFGNTAEGSNIDTISDNSGQYINLSRFTASSAITVNQIKAKVVGNSGKYKCAIYSDNGGNPNSKLTESSEVTNPASGWQTFTIPSTSLTSGSSYWLAIWGSASNASVYYSDTAGTLRWSGALTYGSWPSPLATTGGGSYKYCIYALASAGATATPVPTATPTPTPTPVSGAYIGRNTVGSANNGSAANDLNAFRFTAGSNMTVTQMKVYLANSLTGHMKLAIYSHDSANNRPNALVKATAEITNPVAGWNTFTLTSSQALTAGTTYWLVEWADVVYTTKTDTSTGVARSTANSPTYSSTWPSGSLIGAGPWTCTDSIYAQ